MLAPPASRPEIAICGNNCFRPIKPREMTIFSKFVNPVERNCQAARRTFLVLDRDQAWEDLARCNREKQQGLTPGLLQSLRLYGNDESAKTPLSYQSETRNYPQVIHSATSDLWGKHYLCGYR